MSDVHRIPVRVYYEDTDFSGVVYHASYLRFLERGRTEFLRARGMDQRALFASQPPVGFAVLHMDISFFNPAFMDDELMIETCISHIGGASIRMEQRVLRGTQVLIAAKVRIACISRGKAARLPAGLREILAS